MQRSRCDAASAAQDADVSTPLSMGDPVPRSRDCVIRMVLSTDSPRQAWSAARQALAGRGIGGTRTWVAASVDAPGELPMHGASRPIDGAFAIRPPPPGVAACRLPGPLQGWRCERSGSQPSATCCRAAPCSWRAASPRSRRPAAGWRCWSRSPSSAGSPRRTSASAAGWPGVLRSAGLLWLVAHHVEVTVHGVGRIGLLPLGLVLLPAALIERAGRWMTHEGHVTRLRGRRPGGGVDRVPLRAVHRRGRGGEQDRGGGAVAVAGGHRRDSASRCSPAVSARRAASRRGASSPGGCRRGRAR